MPWSDSHSYVHVAIPKTGTTSLVAALEKAHEQGGGSLLLVKEQVDEAFRLKYRLDAGDDEEPGHAKHLSAMQLRCVLGRERFNSCFKFTVVRNPWARTVSRYRFMLEDNRPDVKPDGKVPSRKFHDLGFDAWMERRWAAWKKRPGRYRMQLDKIRDESGRVMVDYIGRLEAFQEAVDYICDRVGLPRQEAPHVNPTGSKHYSEYYDGRTSDMVLEMCREDIEHFGYVFERAPAGANG
ncbi:MAG: sulfotransferase family protein [Lentisphaerae bacterium]|nr:sulfotransferase family protein [Lentisphaerota bacterium]